MHQKKNRWQVRPVMTLSCLFCCLSCNVQTNLVCIAALPRPWFWLEYRQAFTYRNRVGSCPASFKLHGYVTSFVEPVYAWHIRALPDTLSLPVPSPLRSIVLCGAPRQFGSNSGSSPHFNVPMYIFDCDIPRFMFLFFILNFKGCNGALWQDTTGHRGFFVLIAADHGWRRRQKGLICWWW